MRLVRKGWGGGGGESSSRERRERMINRAFLSIVANQRSRTFGVLKLLAVTFCQDAHFFLFCFL